MKIWIDLANSPQVLFFRPLIPEMKRMGHEVTITSRHFAQTSELADQFGFDHTPVGGHGGKKIGKIGFAVMERAWKLIKFAHGKKFDQAISHNSYAQALAAKTLGIPFITSMDYEHQPANHISFRLAYKVVVPAFFPNESLKKYGAKKKKILRYPCTKEEVYLSDFIPKAGYLKSIGIDKTKIIVVMRPPGTWALYHHFDNPLFEQAFEHIVKMPGAQVIFLPRVDFQGKHVQDLGYPNVVVPDRALDGPNLMHCADLVVSGGGSMNREAAVLGTPTYSLFKGRLAAVDRYFVEKGRMKHIDSQDKIEKIPICKKNGAMVKLSSSNDLIRHLVQLMVDV